MWGAFGPAPVPEHVRREMEAYDPRLVIAWNARVGRFEVLYLRSEPGSRNAQPMPARAFHPTTGDRARCFALVMAIMHPTGEARLPTSSDLERLRNSDSKGDWNTQKVDLVENEERRATQKDAPAQQAGEKFVDAAYEFAIKRVQSGWKPEGARHT